MTIMVKSNYFIRNLFLVLSPILLTLITLLYIEMIPIESGGNGYYQVGVIFLLIIGLPIILISGFLTRYKNRDNPMEKGRTYRSFLSAALALNLLILATFILLVL